METWRRFLNHLAPRQDARQPFYPERLEPVAPALLNTMDVLSAAYLGGRLLVAIALRGGTRQKPSSSERLVKRLRRALPEEVVHHLEAEAELILEWLHEAETRPDAPSPRHPEIDLMLAADVESRLELVRLALREGADLELERYDQEDRRWLRHRATPLELIDAQAGDLKSAVVLRDERGECVEVPIKAIRWLMPVSPRQASSPAPPPEPPPAEVLSFPFGGRRPRQAPELVEPAEASDSTPSSSPTDAPPKEPLD
ncbi:hypothetical protein DL240_13535 [Lujinxingia litoralis]|uniref:Uncharacterized protein n=1 Tax=Lujinxingia litoralis TaxID=2211119 RepID=A0A328C4X3_9DELT|nr:hypothetical protein [Lujinxingia litoralis]RAL21150.1 hypothetical protein DL240_13535 [Lujinxingia litoralis]